MNTFLRGPLSALALLAFTSPLYAQSADPGVELAFMPRTMTVTLLNERLWFRSAARAGYEARDAGSVSAPLHRRDWNVPKASHARFPVRLGVLRERARFALH